ncbi:hypothetical protein EUGRSUZ_L03293 [Eucalyptus grandis]|uniref:Potassium channel domain-containing protein n=1 Tax=Eucalyptus grandis TaxID=71139 RepID=A0AAD9WHX5_EUCGR|nr:hypothetical protein EUGRSUZ_L03293 [Eucalyptus grandis]
MAYDNTRESLIGNSVDASNHPEDKNNAVQRRRHCRNYPLKENFPEQNGPEPRLLKSTKEPTLRKILIVLAAYLGMALGGLILGKAADYILEKQQVLLVRATHINDMVGLAEILKEVETHKIRYNFLIPLVHVVVLTVLGTVYMSVTEKFKFVDAFYCVCASITTLGYGDQSFSTTSGRIFAVFWILASTICVGRFFFYLAELCTESRQRSFTKWVLTRNLTFFDLEAADLDDDKVVR